MFLYACVYIEYNALMLEEQKNTVTYIEQFIHLRDIKDPYKAN